MSDEGMRRVLWSLVTQYMSARVFVGFNPERWRDRVSDVIVPFIKALQSRGFTVLVPKGAGCEGCRKTDDLNSESRRPVFCLFLVRIGRKSDTVLAAQIEWARSLGVKKWHGFIFNDGPRTQPVPAFLIEPFRENGIEFCNAIHSPEELVQCLDLALGL